MGRREVLVQLDDELVERLDRLAAERGTNRSELLRLGSARLIVSSRSRGGRIPACRWYSPGVARGDIVRADLGPPAGRCPVCVLTSDAALAMLTAVTCAPITRTMRGIRSEMEVRPRGFAGVERDHLRRRVHDPRASVDDRAVGHLDLRARVDLDRALRYALDIEY